MTNVEKSNPLWEPRPDEQAYALLNDPIVKENNIYGQKIDLLELSQQQAPIDRSLYINENPAIGTNENRNKQHGFYFNADNCIGCHACESACAEKNETASHLAFRSVGYVEGGSHPDYLRLNISMACNHCDDPVCLKGCPTAAYTKHAEYGAVLQDPDTCFGCGYCTWVCPYNAPQLDPIEGQVSKCNMCVDRLEIGLKPACVSACLGNALDFGVIENIPTNRFQLETQIPGFPDPEITHPNIRFQQVKKLPDEMKRTDSTPVKYLLKDDGKYEPVIDRKQGIEKYWNLSRLSSHENPLVFFTLLTQASIGAFFIAFMGNSLGFESFVQFKTSLLYPLFSITCLCFVSLGLFLSTTHLGKPWRFYRGFNNLRYSPVCREGLGIAIYMGMLGLHFLCAVLLNPIGQSLLADFAGIVLTDKMNDGLQLAFTYSAYIALSSALIGLYYMYKCYRIPARPFWNHWQVATSFFGNGLSLGAVLCGLFLLPSLSLDESAYSNTLNITGGMLILGLSLEAIGLYVHRYDMLNANNEGSASHYIQTSTFGKTYLLRNCLIGFTIFCGILSLALGQNDLAVLLLITWSLLAVFTVISSLIGRSLFYVLVIPTTMPGAFFWKNKGFEEHAQDIGLANMPQVGVLNRH